MTSSDITNLRLRNQKIVNTDFTTAAEIVRYMGAMQAQDFSMAKRAIGVRLINATDNSVEDAFNRGEILRTHLLRPTWHFVVPEDIGWMLKLTATQIKSLMKSRNRQLELTEAVFNKSNRIIENLLTIKKYATRDEITSALNNAGISTNDTRLSHLLIYAELDGIICSGPMSGRKQTYALLSERVPNMKILNREESLSELAKRYFTSHGPATVRDFAWWSGLSLSSARQALESVKEQFNTDTILSETFWFKETSNLLDIKRPDIHLLPAYDEYMISYRNRNASISAEYNIKAISVNGIFHPVLVIDGQIEGLWHRTTLKNIVHINFDFFKTQNKKIRKIIEKKALEYATFNDKKLELIMNDHN